MESQDSVVMIQTEQHWRMHVMSIPNLRRRDWRTFRSKNGHFLQQDGKGQSPVSTQAPPDCGKALVEAAVDEH
eukprot:12427058-Karenia_brevis.AAC.1